jgi:hypothetical protein
MENVKQEIESLYAFLHDEVAWIHYRVLVFRQLYESGTEVHDLLRWASPWVFYLIYRDLLNAIVLSLTRLIDPPQQGKGRHYKNASLEYLLGRIKVLEPGPTIDALGLHLKVMRGYCSGIRQWRSKLAAHRDITTVTEPPPFKVVSFGQRDLELALAELRSFMNLLQTSYAGRYGIVAPFNYLFPPPFDDGRSLLDVLRQAVDSGVQSAPHPQTTTVRKLPN